MEELWHDQKAYKEIMQTKTALEVQVNTYNHIMNALQDLEALAIDESFLELLIPEAEALLIQSQRMYISCKFSHELDPLNCFLHIHAGSGGTEAQDWVRILLNMYTKFCQQQGYICELVDIMQEDGDLIKHVTLNISCAKNAINNSSEVINSTSDNASYNNGAFPYGWFKHEHGIHRFVRISPFDKNSRRHTSFVAVSITPEFNDTIDIEINPADLLIKECKASGAGGQHVNKTNSAIQIKHIPTGIVVESQQDRSQHRNRAIAMKMLKSKIYMHEQEKLKTKHQQNTMSQDEITWGNQIRSYVLHPYKLVKDLRSRYEEYDVDKVLNGHIEGFILSNINL